MSWIARIRSNITMDLLDLAVVSFDVSLSGQLGYRGRHLDKIENLLDQYSRKPGVVKEVADALYDPIMVLCLPYNDGAMMNDEFFGRLYDFAYYLLIEVEMSHDIIITKDQIEYLQYFILWFVTDHREAMEYYYHNDMLGVDVEYEVTSDEKLSCCLLVECCRGKKKTTIELGSTKRPITDPIVAFILYHQSHDILNIPFNIPDEELKRLLEWIDILENKCRWMEMGYLTKKRKGIK